MWAPPTLLTEDGNAEISGAICGKLASFTDVVAAG
jgi:hypothetical protein